MRLAKIPSRLRESGFKLLIFSVSCIVCVSILELGLRIQHRRGYNRLIAKYPGAQACVACSGTPGLIYTYIPHRCGSNSQGYRDCEHAREKGDSTFRIVLIGDSIAEGYGVSPQESFGKVLERRLNDSLGGGKPTVEVVLLARSGYSTSQELILLRNEAFQYGPDLVIWSYVLNDPAHPVCHNANGELGRCFFRPRLRFVSLLSKTLFLAREKLVGRKCGKEYHEFLHCAHWGQVKRDIAAIGQVCQRMSTPVVFLIHPVFRENEDFATYGLLELHARLRDLASASGCVVVDLLDAFRAYSPDDLGQHSPEQYDPWHPNAKGHAIIGQWVADVVVDLLQREGRDAAGLPGDDA